jgi:AcrR family transcriptional regulator
MNSRVARRQDLIQRIASQVVHHRCLKGLTLQGVSEATGVSVWALRYNFDDAPRLFRCVVAYYLGRIGERIEYHAPPANSVIGAIQAYANFIAELMGDPEYRDFLYLVLRNNDLPWLRKAYQEKIARRIAQGLEKIVAEAGETHGLYIALQPGAASRFFKQIEAELVLQTYLPLVELPEAKLETRLQCIAREAFEATYTLEWERASAA